MLLFITIYLIHYEWNIGRSPIVDDPERTC